MFLLYHNADNVFVALWNLNGAFVFLAIMQYEYIDTCTIKILKLGTPKIITVAVLNTEQFIMNGKQCSR